MTAADPMTRTDAHTALDNLMAWVGVDGLVAALRSPGLLAQVDQHAAAVRDAIAASGRALDAVTLSGYARSVVAAAARMGRPVPVDVADTGNLLPAGPAPVLAHEWARADWPLVRLVAVCAIAVESDAL
jgi:hypothetical protein